MKGELPPQGQSHLFAPDLSTMLNPKNELYRLAQRFPWDTIEEELAPLYSHRGRPSKPVRLMVSLHLLKHLYNCSDESVVSGWVQNPYWQFFSGYTEFQWKQPCEPSDMVHFRNRVGEAGTQKIFQHTVKLHGDDARESRVIADTTVQEKNIAFPTDTNLRLKIIRRCWKIAEDAGISLRRSHRREVPALIQKVRFRGRKNHNKSAIKAERRLKTVAGKLSRDIIRKLPPEKQSQYSQELSLFLRILNQKRTSKNKIYSLHEQHVTCLSKGKKHKRYEFGNKVGVLLTENTNVIVGTVSFSGQIYDGHTLEPALAQYKEIFGVEAKAALCDRGYRGKKSIGKTAILVPGKAGKHLSATQKSRIRKTFRRRSSIEPIIGHLKSDHRLGRCFLKGIAGDAINALLASAAFNLRSWMRKILPFLFSLLNLALPGNQNNGFSPKLKPNF